MGRRRWQRGRSWTAAAAAAAAWTLLTVMLALARPVRGQQQQQLEAWAQKLGGQHGHDTVKALATDAQGNTYVAGDFRSGAITIGGKRLVNTEKSKADVFVVRSSSSCFPLLGVRNCPKVPTLLPSLVLMSSSFLRRNSTTNSITTSRPPSKSSLPAPTQTHTHPSHQKQAKFDSSGALAWAFSYAGAEDDTVGDIALDASGAFVYVVGSFLSPRMTFGGVVVQQTLYADTGGGAYDDDDDDDDDHDGDDDDDFFDDDDKLLSGSLGGAGGGGDGDGSLLNKAQVVELESFIFLAKLDTRNGQVIWADHVGDGLGE